MRDLEAIDFFRGDSLVADPYPYFELVRARGANLRGLQKLHLELTPRG